MSEDVLKRLETEIECGPKWYGKNELDNLLIDASKEIIHLQSEVERVRKLIIEWHASLHSGFHKNKIYSEMEAGILRLRNAEQALEQEACRE